MKLPALFAALGLAAACGTQPDKNDTPMWVGTVPHALQMQRIDPDTTYMRDLVVHVAVDHKSAPGIDGVVDSWKTVDGQTLTEPYLTGSKEALDAYLANRHPPPDHVVALEQVDAGRWRTHVLWSPVEIDQTGIAKAEIAIDPNTHRDLVRLDFTPAAARHFADLTAAMVGEKLAVVVDGKVVSAPIINGAIRGGTAEVSFGNDAEAHAFVDTLAP